MRANYSIKTFKVILITLRIAAALQSSPHQVAYPLLLKNLFYRNTVLTLVDLISNSFSPTNFERKYIEEGRVIRRYAFRRLARGGAAAEVAP